MCCGRRGHIAHREQAENHRVQQAVLLQHLQARLEEQRQRQRDLDELERQAEVQRQLAQAQLLNEQRQRQLAHAQLLDDQRHRDQGVEQQRQRDLDELERQAEMQRQNEQRQRELLQTRYGLLHYEYLTCQTGPVIFFSTYLI